MVSLFNEVGKFGGLLLREWAKIYSGEQTIPSSLFFSLSLLFLIQPW